ncbi:ThuA domain-containing protein [Saliphagus sp. LR7]|uniref:ThuA domain-containing protein n=1 Tax=Saliphagus sp. LR7 TaxID=2282654 RepID=UPI000DF8055C|nr:ThuA domain-containing protein [Saliphagus sp. LR7]
MTSDPIDVLAIGDNDFPFHRFEEMGPHIADAVGSERIDVALTTEKGALEAPDADVVLDYLTDSTLTDGQQEGLLSFVKSGGGYFGLHCASDLTSTVPVDDEDVLDSRDEPIEELRDLVGGHFLTHPEQSAYGVRIVDSHHPITVSAPDLRVFDEPYVVDVSESVRVLARMDHPDHADMPVLWVQEYGDGRSAYCSIGHTVSTLSNPDVAALLRNCVRWSAGE